MPSASDPAIGVLRCVILTPPSFVRVLVASHSPDASTVSMRSDPCTELSIRRQAQVNAKPPAPFGRLNFIRFVGLNSAVIESTSRYHGDWLKTNIRRPPRAKS